MRGGVLPWSVRIGRVRERVSVHLFGWSAGTFGTVFAARGGGQEAQGSRLAVKVLHACAYQSGGRQSELAMARFVKGLQSQGSCSLVPILAVSQDPADAPGASGSGDTPVFSFIVMPRAMPTSRSMADAASNQVYRTVRL